MEETTMNKKKEKVDKTASSVRIKKICSQSGISTKKLAEILGITYQGAWKILSGKTLPTLKHLYTISKITGFKIDLFLVEK